MENKRYELNKQLAQMLKGGVIMDVTTPEQAKIAEAAGACAVMALERIPADIRAAGGVSRMSDPKMIKGIQEAVSIPVMAKCRIGHFVEAQVLEAIEIDYIDESEVLSPADDVYHINKREFKVPFVCGARDLGEALRRIAEGASMIRTKGEPGTGDVVQAVRHMRAMNAEIRRVQNLREDEIFEAAKQLQVPVDLLQYVHDNGKLPVVNFVAGGVATPADAALMMQLGAEGVFVGSGIFKSGDPAKRAAAIVKSVTNYTDAKLIAELSEDLGEATKIYIEAVEFATFCEAADLNIGEAAEEILDTCKGMVPGSNDSELHVVFPSEALNKGELGSTRFGRDVRNDWAMQLLTGCRRYGIHVNSGVEDGEPVTESATEKHQKKQIL